MKDFIKEYKALSITIGIVAVGILTLVIAGLATASYSNSPSAYTREVAWPR